MLEKPERELKPRNGHTLVVGIGARISGCQNQKDLSLEDQEDNAKELIKSLYDGPAEFRAIATTGKGERLDRPELLQFEAAYRSNEFDVFVFDDLGRLIRGGDAVRLLGIGVDHGVRTISIQDDNDTVEPTWEEGALTASSENVAHNQRTSMRIKQKTMNRFKKNGATSRRRVFGYIVPPGVKTYDDWQKDPSAEPHILEGKRILRSTLNGEAVADYFRQNQVPVGPYARNKTWNGTMVLRFYRNTILKGMPQRGKMTSVKHHETGRRSSKKNPKGPNFYAAPHLAFFSPEEFDELVAMLDAANANYRRKKINGLDPRANVPRKRTRFPGQFSCCWYCGRHQVWGGNGVTDNLMCSGSRQWLCWDSVGYDGRLAVVKLVDRIAAELYQLEGFDDQYRELVEKAARDDRPDIAGRRNKLRNDEQSLAMQKSNLQNAIMEYGPKQMFKEKLDEIESLERKVNMERRSLERIGQNRLQVPGSLAELRSLLEQEFAGAAFDSSEFGDILRKIVLDFRVYLVRLCDGGHLLPRARVRLALDGVVPDAALIPGVSEILFREFTLDLFEQPQRERIREAAVGLAAQGLGPRAIAARIVESGDKHPTATAVQNALALDRLMKQMGLPTPYVHIGEPPEDYAKLRRHKNAKYRFTPLDGYVPPTL